MTVATTSDAQATPVILSLRFCLVSEIVGDFFSNFICRRFVVIFYIYQ